MTLPPQAKPVEDPLASLPWPAPFTYDAALHDVLVRLQANADSQHPRPHEDEDQA